MKIETLNAGNDLRHTIDRLDERLNFFKDLKSDAITVAFHDGRSFHDALNEPREAFTQASMVKPQYGEYPRNYFNGAGHVQGLERSLANRFVGEMIKELTGLRDQLVERLKNLQDCE